MSSDFVKIFVEVNSLKYSGPHQNFWTLFFSMDGDELKCLKHRDILMEIFPEVL